MPQSTKTALLLATLVALAGAGYGSTAREAERPAPTAVDCVPVEGVEALLERARVVLVGEIHGTRQSPAFVAAVACHAAASGKAVTVGLELGDGEAGRISAYLASDGSAAARRALVAGPPWQAAQQYGSTSRAMLELVDQLRRLRLRRPAVEIVLFHRAAGTSQERDRRMAAVLAEAIEASPADLFLVLTGNIHSRLAVGTGFDPGYEPMGYLIRRAHPEWKMVALDVAHAGGSAWICTPDGCGARDLSGRGSSAGAASPPSITLESGIQENGHHGRYHVGEIEASPPARIDLQEPPAGGRGLPE